MLFPLLSVLAFFLGIALETVLELPLKEFCWIGVLLVMVFIGRRQWGILCCGLGFLLGVWRVDFFERNIPQDLPHDQWVEWQGRVVEEPDRREDHQKLTLKGEWGRVLVKASLYEYYPFGAEVKVSGILEEPSEDLDGFSYKNYLGRYRIWSTISEPHLEILGAPPPSLKGVLLHWKTRIEALILYRFMEPEAGFVNGLLLGSRKGMGEDLVEAFKVTGLSHIVAISGYNITLIIAGVFWIFSFLALRPRILLSGLILFLFVLLVGASAAVVRAGIMGGVTLCGVFLGMRSQVFFALLWSAFLMVLCNPMILMHDVGFQLSFSATLGLLLWMPVFEEWWPGPENPHLKSLYEGLLLTLCAQMITGPLIAFQFGRVSLISPLANVVVAPFLPLAMGFSAMALFVPWPFTSLAWFNLRLVENSALLLSKIPFADFSLQVGVLEFAVFLILESIFLLRFYKPILVRAFHRGGEEVFPQVEAS